MAERHLERHGRNRLAELLGRFFPVQKISPDTVRKRLESTPAPKILFVRPHQGLGDLLLATPVFRALKKTYPTLQIHFLADTYNEVAIRDNQRLDKIWIWDKKKMRAPWRLWSFLRVLRAEKFLVALPLSSHVPSFTSFLLARFSGAEFVWAYETHAFYGGANWSKHLAHAELKPRPENDPEWVKFMESVRPLVGPTPTEDFAPEFDIQPDQAVWAEAAWSDMNLPKGKKKIGLFFGGNPDRPERLWPADYWAELAAKLQAEDQVSLVAIVPPPDFLSGSRALERGVYPEVAKRLKEQPPVFANRDLAQVAAFLKGLDLFVCVDGGLFHIAVGARIHTLGLFFKTDPACWKPPVPWASVLRPADDLPKSLTPQEVYHKISEMVLKSTYV